MSTLRELQADSAQCLGPRFHHVVSGEYLIKIANNWNAAHNENVTWQQIYDANSTRIENWQNAHVALGAVIDTNDPNHRYIIYPGQALLIPNVAGTEAPVEELIPINSNSSRTNMQSKKAVILYPSFGMPELIFGNDKLNVIIGLEALSGALTDDTHKKMVSEHLCLSDHNATQKFYRNQLTVDELMAQDYIPQEAIESITEITDSKFFTCDNKRMKGLFRSNVYDYFKSGKIEDIKKDKDEKAKDKPSIVNPYGSGDNKIELTYYHIEIDSSKLTSGSRELYNIEKMKFLNWIPTQTTVLESFEVKSFTWLMAKRTGFVGDKIVKDSDSCNTSKNKSTPTGGVLKLLNDKKATFGGTVLNTWDITENKFTELAFMALHPVFFYREEKILNVAFTGDVHIVSRLEVMSKSDLQIIPGVDEDVSPLLSDCITPHSQNFKKLITLAGKSPDYDALLIGGDLIDFSESCYPGTVDLNNTNPKDKVTTGMPFEVIWKFTNVDPDHIEFTNQHGVDFMGIFLMLVNFLVEYKKPVIVCSGNHDGYEKPFGMSPRIAGETPNSGMAADANLTIMEACLLYGDKYDYVPFPKIKPVGYFDGSIADMFFFLLCPFESYTCKFGRMQLIITGWTKEETMVFESDEIGDVPVATKNMTENDLKIVDYGAQITGGGDSIKRLLMSHYTYVCFEYKDVQDKMTKNIALNGKMSPYGLRGIVQDNYCFGTCAKNKDVLFKYFNADVGKPQIHYTLSGHAHRGGVYGLINAEGESADIVGMPIINWSEEEFLSLPNDNHNVRKYPKIMVCDSSGPVPRENLSNEFNGNGSCVPSILGLTFDFAGELIDLKRESSIYDIGDWKKPLITIEQSRKLNVNRIPKPRIGVSLDYMESIQVTDNTKTIVDVIDISIINKEITGNIFLNKIDFSTPFIPDWVVFGKIKIVLFAGLKPIVIDAELLSDGDSYKFKCNSLNTLLRDVKKIKEYGFISIYVNKPVSGVDFIKKISQSYDFLTPWITNIKVKKIFKRRTAVSLEELELVMSRDGLASMTPDFDDFMEKHLYHSRY
ncbi:MAG: metallophosphoesterase [Fibrobacterales bacterium]